MTKEIRSPNAEKCSLCHTPLEMRDGRPFCPACVLRDLMEDVDVEAETEITPPPAVGDMPRVPRHSMIEKIGEGGFANVYRALQREPVRREVAIKVLKSQVASYHVLARFETERQTLARMEHPGIARLWDSGVTMHGQPFFAMELVRGEPVTMFCERLKLGLEERLDLFCSICEAVQHAHEKGVLHRDLKPSNILVSGSGDERAVKIIDFGIAKALEATPDTDDTSTMTSIHQTVGTPGYMSPEQGAWGVQNVDVRSDLYALGVVLYELITGRTPLQVERKANEEARQWPVAKHVTAPSVLPGSLLLTKTQRRDLDAITLKALQMDSTRRYASAAAFADDVRRHLHDEPVLAGERSWTYVMEKFTKRHLPFVVSGAVALIAVIGGFTASTLLFFKEQHARANAERAQTVLEVRETELRRTLSRADFATAQRFKQERDHQSAVACLTRALRQDPSFSAAAADLQMLLMQEESPQPVDASASLEKSWGQVEDNSGAVSASGKEIAVLCKTESGQRLMLLLNRDGEWRSRELELPAPLTAVAMAASGNFIAWADTERNVRRIDLDQEDAQPVLWQAPAAVTVLHVAILNRAMAVGCQDGTLWYSPADSPADPPVQIAQFPSAITVMTPMVNDRLMLVGTAGGEVWRVNVMNPDGVRERMLKMPAAVTVLALGGATSTRLAAGDRAGNVLCVSADNQEVLPATRQHNGPVTAMAFADHARQLISAGGARDLRVHWLDIETRAQVLPPVESAGTVLRILVNRGGDEASLVSADSSVRLWRRQGGALVAVRRPQRARFLSMSTTGRAMAVQRDAGGAVEVLQFSAHVIPGVMLDTFAPAGIELMLEDICFTSKPSTLLHTNARANAALWDIRTAKLEAAAQWQKPALALQQPPQGPLLAALADGSLIEVSTDGAVPVVRVPADETAKWALGSISPDGRAAVWAELSEDTLAQTRVRVWLAVDGRVHELRESRVSCVAVHAGNGQVAIGHGNGHVRLVRPDGLRDGYQPLHQSRVTSVAYAPDGRALITTSTDGNAAIWHGKLLTPLSSAFHLGESVLKSAFSPDGRRFACATDSSVIVGDVEARALLGQPFRVRGAGLSLAFSPDSRKIAFTLGAGEITVHDLPPHTSSPAPEWFLRLAETYVSRRMSAQGTVEITEHPGRAAMRGLIPAHTTAESADWESYAQWLFEETGLRTLSPWSHLKLEEYIQIITQGRSPARRKAEMQRLNPLRYREERAAKAKQQASPPATPAPAPGNR